MQGTWWPGYLYTRRQYPVGINQGGIARLLSLKSGQGGLDLIVLGVLRPDVVVDAGSFLFTVKFHKQPVEHFKKHTFWRRSISSPKDLSALYLTLFHVKVRRY